MKKEIDEIPKKSNSKYLIHEQTTQEAINRADQEDLSERVDQLRTMTYYEYAKYEFALISGSSYTDVESMMARGISRTSLCNILYSFIMIRLLIDGLNDNFFLTWYEDSDLFKGSSGISYFFNGIIILEDDISNPWLLKCVTTTHNPLDAITSMSSTLEDIDINRCILFLPTYPSQNAMRFFVYTYAEKQQEIIILYLHDLYELLKMPAEEILNYLVERGLRP